MRIHYTNKETIEEIFIDETSDFVPAAGDVVTYDSMIYNVSHRIRHVDENTIEVLLVPARAPTHADFGPV